MSLSVALIDKTEAVETVLAHCLHYFPARIQRFDSLEAFQAQLSKQKPDILFIDWDFSSEDLPKALDFISHVQPLPVVLMQKEAHFAQAQKNPQIANLHRIKKPLYPAEVRKLFLNLSPAAKEASIYNFLRFPSKNPEAMASKDDGQSLRSATQKSYPANRAKDGASLRGAGAGGNIGSIGAVAGSTGNAGKSGSKIGGVVDGGGIASATSGVAGSENGRAGAEGKIAGAGKGGAGGGPGGGGSKPPAPNQLDSDKKPSTAVEGSQTMIAISDLKKSDEKLKVSSFSIEPGGASAKAHQATDGEMIKSALAAKTSSIEGGQHSGIATEDSMASAVAGSASGGSKPPAQTSLEKTKVHEISGLLSQAAKGLTESADTAKGPIEQARQNTKIFQKPSFKKGRDSASIALPQSETQSETASALAPASLDSLPKKAPQKPKEEETTVKLKATAEKPAERADQARESENAKSQAPEPLPPQPFSKETLNIDESAKNDFAPIAIKPSSASANESEAEKPAERADQARESESAKSQAPSPLPPKPFSKETLNIDESTKHDFAAIAMKSPSPAGDKPEELKPKAFVMSEKDILKTLEKYKDSLEFQNLMEKVLNEQAEKALAGFLQNLEKASFLNRPLKAFQQSQSFREILKKEVSQYIKAELPSVIKEVTQGEITKVIKAVEESETMIKPQEATEEEATKIIIKKD